MGAVKTFRCPAMPVTGARTVLPTRVRVGCGEPGREIGAARLTDAVLVVTRLKRSSPQGTKINKPMPPASFM
jgi:hypothetical protein